MVNLRQASIEDKESILPLLEAFFNESPYKGQEFDRSKVSSILDNLILDSNSLVLIEYNESSVIGVLLAITSSNLFNNNKLATELAWYVLPTYRGKGSSKEYLGAYEYWAKLLGCYCLCLQNIADERLDKMYTKAGYTCYEHTYMKVL